MFKNRQPSFECDLVVAEVAASSVAVEVVDQS